MSLANVLDLLRHEVADTSAIMKECPAGDKRNSRLFNTPATIECCDDLSMESRFRKNFADRGLLFHLIMRWLGMSLHNK